MRHDTRCHQRIEPICVDTLIRHNYEHIKGRVLDLSQGGMAIDLPQQTTTVANGEKVHLDVFKNGHLIDLGMATVQRNWLNQGDFYSNKGFSVQFENELVATEETNDLLSGASQKSRLASQSKLAALDIAHLGNYRCNLINGQIKLFSFAFTVAFALIGAYVGMIYHSIAIAQSGNAILGFWRTMLISLPGLLCIASAIIIAQKNIFIHQIDAYLSILKKCHILNKYPREYHGWESDYQKCQQHLREKKCTACNLTYQSADLGFEEKIQLQRKGLFNKITMPSYLILMNTGLLSIIFLSLTTVVSNTLEFQWADSILLLTASLMSFIMLIVSLLLLKIYYALHKGEHSVEYFKHYWLNILKNCRQTT